MKKFLAAVLAILTLLSMSACSLPNKSNSTKTKEHKLLDSNGKLKGYIIETLETVDEDCTKLEFADENKNIQQTFELSEDGQYYFWEIFGSERSDKTPLQPNIDNSLFGVVHIWVWDGVKACDAGIGYYTYPYTGTIMEEYKWIVFEDGRRFYTFAKYYNEDGSVKWHHDLRMGEYFGYCGTVKDGKTCIAVEEYDTKGETVCITYYDIDTLAFYSSIGNEYTDVSKDIPTYEYYFNEDGSLWYKEENTFSEDGGYMGSVFYGADGKVLDSRPE